MVAFMYLYFDCLGFCLFGWFGVCLFICVYPINVMKRLNSVHDLALSRLGLWIFCEKLHFYHNLNIWIVEHYNFKYILRNWVFATNSDFLIPISLDCNVVNLLIFQTISSVRSNNISLKYQRFTTLGFKDIVIINSEFVAKTQFLCLFSKKV